MSLEKIILIIPAALSIRLALTLKNKSNVKRSVFFLTAGALIVAFGEVKLQEPYKIFGAGLFLYGLGIVAYYKFKEGLNRS
ncbi:conserved hypothetical protein [anaerobic digester metagenome]|jgi:Ca2+/Na+ antiporter|uniref:Uncharacterized protein n=1 Tax=anaerobic digester metagenome TaxID=1263854 RepID=A0A485M2B2_9ZZZZ